MAFFLLVSLLLVAVASAQNCIDKYGNGVEIGGEMKQGNGYFRCNFDGRLQLEGCSSNRYGNVRFGEKVTGVGYELTCIEESDGVPYLQPTSCIFNDRVVAVGEEVPTDYYVYRCNTGINGVSMEVAACVDDDGSRVSPGGRVIRGKTVYQCQTDNTGGSVQIVPVGCIFDGAEFQIGTSYEGNNYWFSCTKFPDGTVYGKVGGCMNKGERIMAGSRYHANGFEMECRQDANSIQRRVIGCLQKNTDGTVISHPVGGRWVQGKQPFQYAMTCRTCGGGDVVTRSPEKCQFNVGLYREPLFEVDPGCMVPKGTMIYCCGTTPSGGLYSQIDYANRMDNYRKKGFRKC